MKKIISTILILLLVLGTVIFPVTTNAATPSITLNYTSITNYTGKSYTITATVKNTTETVKWTTSNKSICSISTASGKSTKVTLVKAGTCTITGTVAGKSAKCTVTVKQLVTSVSLPTTTTVFTGETVTITPTIAPANATNKTLTWTTSNSSIATVDSNGKVTGKTAGTVTITATTKDSSNKTATCKVTVKQKASSISLSPATLIVYAGYSTNIKVLFQPIDTTNRGIKWTTSNNAIATVSETGEVKGIKSGSCIITATTTDGTNLSANAMVTVRQYVNSITLSSANETIYTGKSVKLTATVGPDNAFDKSVKWYSNNNTVASVTQNGEVTANKAGTAIITVIAIDGSNTTATCKITVKQRANSISLSSSTLILNKGSYHTLKTTILPDDTSDKSVSWSTSNSSIATVDNSGKITAKGIGTATITATTKDGSNLSASCKVTVKQLVSSITLSQTKMTIDMGKTAKLNATILPSDATEKKLQWSVNNKGVVSITQSGEIQTLGLGTAVITVSATDGSNVSASCSITVVQKVTSMKLNSSTIKLNKLASYQLKPTITPENATNKTLSWTTSNSNVATVDNSGKITSISTGTATITATTTDGSNIKTSCKVTVVQNPTEIVLSKNEINLFPSKNAITTTLTTTLSPADTTEKELIWQSDNEKVAKVSNGKITTVGNGSCTIKVTSKAEKNVTATCKVNVTTKAYNITIAKNSYSVDIGGTLKLQPVFYPKDTADKTIFWSTSNPDIATVENGVVIGNTRGSCIITGVSSSNPSLQIKCNIKVNKIANNMRLNTYKITLNVKKSRTLKATIYPTDTDNKAVKWTTTNKKVATVDSKGKITAKKKGSCYIIATSCSNQSVFKKCKVTVKQPVTKIKLNKTKITIKKGAKYKFKVTVYPKNASNKAVKWTTTNKKVATVDSKGKVTAKKRGTCYIRATAKDGSKKYAKCKVTVKQPVTKISINYSTASLFTGHSFTLKAYVYPTNANNKKIKWTSSNYNVATVSSSGKVTAINKGTCTIYAKSKDNSKKYAKCKVTVKQLGVPSAYFRSFSLSDTQIKRIASLCYQEQGSVAGATAEASLMANLYDLTGQTGSIYNFILNAGWWANAPYYMSKECTDDRVVKAVTLVLCYGKRTLPKYVDEHDCLSDITYQSTASFERHVTVIKNCYGSTYTFYSFPATGSDPFGYTSKDNREKYGDFCYKFSDLNI